MSQPNRRPEASPNPPEPELQRGHGRSIVRNEQLKRVARQHPRRDEPKVDSIDDDETPPP
jgi:hypothetical protein